MSTSARVTVIRNQPRPRNVYRNLTGILKVSINTESYLHVGSGIAHYEAPNPDEILKSLEKTGWEKTIEAQAAKIGLDYLDMVIVDDKPCIPGSSVKGNVRSRIELSLTNNNGKTPSCFIKASPPQFARDRRAYRHRKVWGNVLDEDRGFPCDYTKSQNVCMVCDMFGTAGLSGLVAFTDFVGEKVVLENVAGQHGLKLRIAPPKSVFRGSITFRNLEPHELGLLLHGLGIQQTATGKTVLLGRLKYVGNIGGKPIGKIRYILESLTFSEFSEQFRNHVRGKPITGTELENLVRDLVSEMKTKLGPHLRNVQEVTQA